MRWPWMRRPSNDGDEPDYYNGGHEAVRLSKELTKKARELYREAETIGEDTTRLRRLNHFGQAIYDELRRK